VGKGANIRGRREHRQALSSQLSGGRDKSRREKKKELPRGPGREVKRQGKKQKASRKEKKKVFLLYS